MQNGRHLVYEFGDFRLDPGLRILLRKGEPVTVWPKVFDTLALLLQSSGRIVEKEELMQALWPDSFVEESNLTQNIFILRKILGDDRNGHSFIQTVPRRGYKFVARVHEADPATSADDLSASYWRGRSPFRGLQVFETEDAWLFFGREPETQELLAHLKRSPVLSVVGNSGSGKSSLVRAGLIPTLQEGRFCTNGLAGQQWRIALFRPSVAPLDSLAEVLPVQLAPELSLQERAEFIREFRKRLGADAESLRDTLAALAGAISYEPGLTRILLVADQFEEIFTLTDDCAVRNAYINALLTAARCEGPIPVHVVFAVRADFYPECMEHAGLSRAMAANQYNVGRMSHEQLRESIEKRLHLASAQAEPGLIGSLLQDVGSEPGNLALLEHALGQLWERCGGFGCTLTNHAYAEIGRLQGALGRHADEVYTNLRDDTQKQLAKRIFLELVHVGNGAQDARRRIAKADLLSLAQPEEVETLLSHLASTRLISTGGEEQEGYVEVSHEALIREWPLLRDWLSQNREDLQLERRLLQAVEEWNSLNRDDGALLQGARLAQAEEWLDKNLDAPDLLQDFVVASVAARKQAQERELAREKAAAARLRWFSASLAVLLLLAVGTAVYIHHQRVLEKSRAMAAQSGEMLSLDHGRALDLAMRSWTTAESQEARLAVTKALPETLAILKHDAPVIAAVFSPDGRLIATGSHDRSARIWDAVDGRLLRVLQGHTDKIVDVNFSPDSRKIVTASDDRTVRVWSAVDGRLLFTLKGHSGKLLQADFSPDGRRIVSSGFDNTARVWDATTGKLLLTLLGHTDAVGTAKFSPDGQHILTASWDRTARVWNSADGRLITILEHDSAIICAAFSPDNQTLTTGTVGGVAKVWNSTDSRLLFTLPQPGPVSAVEYSHDSQRILISTLGPAGARVWNRADGRLLFELREQDSETEYAQFSRDGKLIVTAGFDHVARVWDGTNGRLLATLAGHSERLWDVQFSPDGQRILTASYDNTARLWNIASGRSTSIMQGHAAYIQSVNVSRDGQHIVTASWDKTARVWSADGRLLATLKGHSDTVAYAIFSPDGQRIVTTSYDHTAKVWNTADGRLMNTLAGHSAWCWGARFSPDGRRILTASLDRTGRIWNAADGRLLAILQGHSDGIGWEEFSPDGQHIITASSDHTARLWSAADGRPEFTLEGHTDKLTTARFSPDSQHVVTASCDRTARIWDAHDGRLLTTLKGHLGCVASADYSPDGRRIITASDDGSARVWNAGDGTLLFTLQGHSDRVAGAKFSPNGKWIMTLSADNTARVWNATDGSLVAILQGHTAPLTGAFFPDSRHIVTASLDTTARTWEILTLDDVRQILRK